MAECALIFVHIAEKVETHFPSPVYQLKLFQWVQKTFKHFTLFDVDNHSEPLTVQYAVSLVASMPCFLLIQSDAEAEISSLMPFFRKLERSEMVKEVVMLGSNPLIERMIKLSNGLSLQRFEKEAPLKEYLLHWNQKV